MFNCYLWRGFSTELVQLCFWIIHVKSSNHVTRFMLLNIATCHVDYEPSSCSNINKKIMLNKKICEKITFCGDGAHSTAEYVEPHGTRYPNLSSGGNNRFYQGLFQSACCLDIPFWACSRASPPCLVLWLCKNISQPHP